jgi:phosphosulfolactate phosphohydrolase-like enzyme
MRAFGESPHGRALRGLGFESDLRFAAQVDIFDSVPMLYNEDGVPTLRTAKRR